MSKSLNALARLRALALDEARRILAERIDTEAAAFAALRDAEATMARERQAAQALGTGDALVAAFAAWLPRGRAAIARSATAHDAALAATARARAALGAARSAAEAVDLVIAQHDTAATRAVGRRAQAALDEHAPARKTPARRRRPRPATARWRCPGVPWPCPGRAP